MKRIDRLAVVAPGTPDAGTRYARRLVAILYADVARYCRLTGADEDGTHALLSEYLDVVAGAIARHAGEISHYAGDAVLARFATVTDAVTCALAIQRTLGLRNAALPRARRAEFRIGINVGDVIADRDDIFGHAVNVAARLQGLAPPGGICVSEAVRAAAGAALTAGFRSIGRPWLKNIGRPLRAYSLAPQHPAPARGPSALLRRLAQCARRLAGAPRVPVAEGAEL